MRRKTYVNVRVIGQKQVGERPGQTLGEMASAIGRTPGRFSLGVAVLARRLDHSHARSMTPRGNDSMTVEAEAPAMRRRDARSQLARPRLTPPEGGGRRLEFPITAIFINAIGQIVTGRGRQYKKCNYPLQWNHQRMPRNRIYHPLFGSGFIRSQAPNL